MMLLKFFMIPSVIFSHRFAVWEEGWQIHWHHNCKLLSLFGICLLNCPWKESTLLIADICMPALESSLKFHLSTTKKKIPKSLCISLSYIRKNKKLLIADPFGSIKIKILCGFVVLITCK